MMYGYHFGPQDWLLMLAMMAVMTVITVVAVVAIVRAVRRGRASTSARAVLDKRFAGGELSSEQYQERKRRLAEQ